MRVRHDQHMMVDRAVVREIVELSGIMPGDMVLEIGGGTGNLTRELAKKTKKLVVVEIDPKMVSTLRAIKGVRVVKGNALAKMGTMRFDRIVANIPYSISEPLMKKLMGKSFKSVVITVPKLFARTIMARKSSPLYSRLSIECRVFFRMETLLDVKRRAFDPQPDTDSVVVRIRPLTGNMLIQEVLKRDGLKVKNAIIRALFVSLEMDKRSARKAINTMNLNTILLEKRLRELDASELDAVLHAISHLGRGQKTIKDL